MLTRAPFLDGCQRGVGIFVARAGTIAQLVHPIENRIRAFVFLMLIDAEIIGVAARAIGPVGGRRIGRIGSVRPVAIGAIKPTRMAAGEGPREMAVRDPLPPGCAVTLITLSIGLEMAIWFTGGDAAIMTGRAPAVNRRMIKPHIAPAGGDVTVFAGIGAGDVIARLAGGDVAIVTSLAGPVDRRMVKPHIAPAGCDVAIVTGV